MNEPRYFYETDTGGERGFHSYATCDDCGSSVEIEPDDTHGAPNGYFIRDQKAPEYIGYSLQRTDAERIVAALNAAEAARAATPR